MVTRYSKEEGSIKAKTIFKLEFPEGLEVQTKRL